MRQTSFRTIFEGILIGDWMASLDADRQTLSSEGWRPLLVEVAQSCAAGKGITGNTYGAAFHRVNAESLVGCLLSALPVLLLNVNRYGHRQPYIHQWGAELALPPATIAAVTELFTHLCQIYGRCQIYDAGDAVQSLSGCHRWPDPGVAPYPSASPLAAAQHLVQNAQGQFWLGLSLAQQQGWDAAQIGLVSLLTIVRNGQCAIPLGLRQNLEHQHPMPNDLGWSATDRRKLLQASTDLYYQWSGIQKTPWLSSASPASLVAVTS